MKLRKTLLILLGCSLLLTGSLLYAVYAYMYKQTETVNVELDPARVTCEVHETFADGQKTEIAVKNTGNIDAYLRVRLVTYWVNDNDEIMPEASQMPSFSVASGWISLGEDTYCYNAPVAPDSETPNLLASSIALEPNSKGYRQVVVVFAEAIQANPKTAVTEAWGVSANQLN